MDGRSKKRPGPEKQREVIRAAAVDLFIERGEAAVSIAEICERADVGRQTFYRCFADKEALVTDLYQYAINTHIDRAVARLPAEGSSARWPYEVVDEVIDAILEEHKLAQLLYVEAANPNSAAFKITDSSLETAALAIQAWFEDNVGERPSKTHVKSVLAATTWLVHDAILAGLTKAAVAEAKRASQKLLEGVYLTTTRDAKRRDAPGRAARRKR